MNRHRITLVVAVIGAVLVAAHAILAVAGTMTASQWQSGVAIGLIRAVPPGRTPGAGARPPT